MLGIHSRSINFIILNDPQMCSMENRFCQPTLQHKRIQEEAEKTNSGSMAVTSPRLQLPWYFLYGNW